MGILEHADRHVYELSGGMRQRVALARSLANDPQVLLMDEPFAAVDALTRRTLQKELVRIWETARKSVLFITHSVEEAVLVSDRVLVMSARPGRIIGNRRITLPRPRDEHSPEFAELRRELDGLLSHEDSPSEVEPVQAQTWTEGEIKGGTA
jgi:ABC-type nitrate/sulfonate/bicarbonate transport system ATPase subunit